VSDKELIKELYHPSIINKGSSTIINNAIYRLLYSPVFNDGMLSEEIRGAIDSYLKNESMFIFAENFEDEDGYQIIISKVFEAHIDSAAGLRDPALAELLIKTMFADDSHVNYVTPDENENLVVKKIKPHHNTKMYDFVMSKIKKVIETGEYDAIFSNTFLSEIITRGYTYEKFKKQLSTNIAKGLKSGSLGAQVSLSDDFLGKKPAKVGGSAGDGPLAIKVVDEGSLRLSKEFPAVPHSITIPRSKLKNFKEVTKWEKNASFFGKTSADGEDSTYFTDDQIDIFADSISGKDITQNEFLYYTGEVYDEYSKVFDADYWGEVLVKLSEVSVFSWNMIVDSAKSFAYGVGGLAAFQSAVWGHALMTFELAPITLGAAPAVPTAGWWATRTKSLVSAGRWIISRAASPTLWLVLINVAIISALGYALLSAGQEGEHKQRLNKLVIESYSNFIAESIVALSSGRPIGDLFRRKANDDQLLRHSLAIFALDKEVERRVRLWSRFSFELNRNENFLDDGNADAVREAIEDSTARGFRGIELPDIDELTDEQIQDRQKFYKQCALMMNLHKFAPVYEGYILDRQAGDGFDGPDKTKPFGGRFWRATSKNKEKLINNLFSSDKSQYLFEIPPHVMSQLVPKFRLYKVLNDRQTGKLTRTEFVFPTHTDLSRTNNFTKPQSIRKGVKIESEVPSFLGPNFDKGDGVGLKSFTLEFNGTNPAEARNDVQGSLSLYFQSFADFIRERIDHNGNKFSYVDLIVQPEYDDGDDKGTIQGVPTSSLREYDPSFYRIMVETGYIYPESIEGISGDDLKKLQSAIKNMNKSFYLCMVDHEFKINNDGTVEVSLTYRAYIETALKTLRFDALTTPELAKQRIINQTKLYELATSQECTIDQLQDVKVLISSIEEEIIKNSLNSIMTRLFKRDKIFVCEIDDGDRRQFLNDGYFRKCDIVSETNSLKSEDSTTGDLGVVLNTRLPEESSGFDFNDSDENDTLVQFFFFGDLLHTILDALYIEEDGSRSRGLENTMIVLGSFDFEAFQNETGATINSFNISQIPISVEFFSRWFVENVINQKSTRRSFPILNFIRNLSNALVSNSLLESCVNRDIEQRLIFQTGQFSCYNETGSDVLGGLTSNFEGYAIIDTDNQRGISLPLEGSPAGDSKIENFHHYIILNPNGSTRNHDGKGIYSQDIGNGVFHMEIGSNRGIVKTINFSKTDMQYLREARFIRNGVDGLMQLSSVYNVSIEMFGNTLFYPGMDLWLNPYGFGGTTLGSPTQRKEGRSLANILGIGGYHTITKVSVNLTPNSFTTSIQAQHYYSGDGEMGSLQPKISKVKGSDEQLIEMGILEEDQTAEEAANCLSEIVDLQNFGNENATAFDRQAFIDSQTSEGE
jgi:hypothetical protein